MVNITLSYASSNIYLLDKPILNQEVKYGSLQLQDRIQKLIQCLIDIKNDSWTSSSYLIDQGLYEQWERIISSG